MVLKKCTTCDYIGDNFHKNKNSKDGLTTLCKECACRRSNLWAKNNLEQVVQAKKARRQDIRKSLLESAQSRASQYNIPLTITLDDIVVPTTCPIFGFPLVKSPGKASYNSPSLDKIVPELGYVPGNIQVISYKANMMKNNASSEDLIKFAKWILDE